MPCPFHAPRPDSIGSVCIDFGFSIIKKKRERGRGRHTLTKSCPSSEWSFSMVVTINPCYEQTRQATALDNAEGEAIQGVFKGR